MIKITTADALRRAIPADASRVARVLTVARIIQRSDDKRATASLLQSELDTLRVYAPLVYDEDLDALIVLANGVAYTVDFNDLETILEESCRNTLD